MSHISHRARWNNLHLAADYVVVGSGAGGATIAAHLARGGAEVLLIEAGAWRDPEHYPESAFGGMRDLMDDFGSTMTRGRALWPIVQARTVGATTVVNSAIAVRTPDDVFDLWRTQSGIDGTGFRTELLRFQDELDTELKVGIAPASSRGRNNELAMQGAQALGIEGHWMRRYVDDCSGSGACMTGCREGKKQSLNLNFVPEVLERGGTVLSNASVQRIDLDGRRATGVRGRFHHPRTRQKGARFTVRANKAVIVAASATHSPCLLERSGVRSPALGKYFRAHPGSGVCGIYPDHVDMGRGNTQGWASLEHRLDKHIKLETLSLPPEMLMTRIQGGGTTFMERLTELRNMAMWVQALRAESVGTVRNGLFDRPAVAYTLDARDMARFRHGMATVARLHFAAGATSVTPGIHGLPYRLGPDEVHRIDEAPLDPQHYLGILSHLFGGCVMGTDPRTSVCDREGRVHGYQGLCIADASMIPSTLGVNPQHTIMALARWVGANLLEHAPNQG